MIGSALRLSWRAVGAACCSCLFFSLGLEARTVLKQGLPAQSSAKESREQGPQLRIPRQQAQNTAALDGFVRDAGSPNNPLPIPGTVLSLRHLESGKVFNTSSSAEGVFRLFPLPPGKYELHAEAQNYAHFSLADLTLQPNEVVTLEISLASSGSAGTNSRLPRLPDLGPPSPSAAPVPAGSYRELRHRLDSDATSKTLGPKCFRRSQTFTTQFRIAGRSSSLITGAIRRTASTSTSNRAGTIHSIAIASKATNRSGRSFSASRFS